MRERILRFAIVVAFVISVPLSVAAQNPQPPSAAVVGQGDMQARQELSDKFKANARTDHRAAYAAGKEYLRRFPEDDDENAQFMKRWVAAYEKVAAKDKEAARVVGVPKAADAASTTPSFLETVSWLREKLSIYGSVKYRSFVKGKPEKKAHDAPHTNSNRIVDIGNCTVTIEVVNDIPATKKFAASWKSDKYTIPLSSTDPDSIDAWSNNEEEIPYNSAKWPFYIRPENRGKVDNNLGVVVPSSAIRLHVKGDAKLIDVARRDRWFDGSVHTENFAVSSVQLLFSDAEIAKRAAVAFSNAIKVCQGVDKKSPF